MFMADDPTNESNNTMSDENKIVPAGGALAIKEVKDYLDEIVSSVTDMESAEQANDTLDDILRKMMRQADVYGEVACYAAYSEARLLIEVSRMNVAPTFRKPMIAWLSERTDEELMEILATCSRGIRISHVKAQWTRGENQQRSDEAQIEEHKRLRQKLIKDLTETGRTNISYESYMSQWSLPEKPDVETFHAYRELIRTDALRTGAVGIGDGSSEYLLPEIAKSDEMREALETRLRSVDADLRSIVELCGRSNLKMPKSAADSLGELLKEISRLLREAVTE